ncbi:MAG: metal-sensitive transcriptional regulator [Candidatus Sericytochromatia bacterium]
MKKKDVVIDDNIETENKELIHRLNRIIGQLEAIKRTLQTEENKDCVQTIRLLKAANNAIKKFGEAYVNDHLSKCIVNNKPPKEIEQGLKEVIGSVFNM